MLKTKRFLACIALTTTACGSITYTNANVTQPVIIGRVDRIGGAPGTISGGRKFTAEVSTAASAESGGGVNMGHQMRTSGSNASDVGILTVLEKPTEQVRVEYLDTGTYVLNFLIWGFGKS